MADATDGSSDGPTDQALQELLRAEHHRAEVEARRRRRELHRQAMESLSILDVLRELAGTGDLVVVGTRRGSLPPSLVIEVGRDYVILRSPGRETRLVPATAIASFRTTGSAPLPLAAGLPDEAAATLHDRLTELALRRPRARVAGPTETATGYLRSVGLDLLVLTQDDGTDVVVALEALEEVAL